MLDHMILTVSNVERSLAFYEAALKPLNIKFFLPYKGLSGLLHRGRLRQIARQSAGNDEGREGEGGSLLVGRGSLNQPFSAGDMLRERVSNHIGQASDEQVSRLALTEHVVVTIPANTPIYVVLEKNAKAKSASAGTTGDGPPLSNSANTDELRQLLQLRRELRQTAASEEQ